MFDWKRLLLLPLAVVILAVCLSIWLRPVVEPGVSPTPEPAAGAAEAKLTQAVTSGSDSTTPAAPDPVVSRFEKLDRQGRVVPRDAETWECVRDNVNNLMWEVKQNNAAVRDLDFTYSWYSARGETGVRDGGECFYIDCDTQSLVDAVNEAGLCGRHDWRLPTNLELMTLDTEREFYAPDIDQRYFPNTRPGYYWSSTPADVGESLVWSINFLNGFPYVTETRLAYHVRLVRDDAP